MAAPLWKAAMRKRALGTVVSHVLLVAGLVNVAAATLSKRAESNTRLEIQNAVSPLSGKFCA